MANNYTEFSAVLVLRGEDEQEWWNEHIARCNKNNEEENDYIDHCTEIDDDGNAWFRSDECGDVDQIAYAVNKFFREMRPRGDDEFVMSWSNHCSALRVGEFSGGTMIITKEGMGYCCETQQEEYARKNIRKL